MAAAPNRFRRRQHPRDDQRSFSNIPTILPTERPVATAQEPLAAPELAKRFARARAADAGEILKTLCAIGKARHGPPSPKPAAGQAKAEGMFLP
jgi:hypothetical protein